MTAFDTAQVQDLLTEAGEGAFSPTQARRLTRALSAATEHVPSRDGLDSFQARVMEGVSSKLNEQTRWVAGLIFGVFLLNALTIAGVGLALYNALRS